MRAPLVGDVVRLRAREPEDAVRLHRWRNDWDVIATIMATYPTSVASFQVLPAERSPGYKHAEFIVERLEDGQPIGQAELEPWRPESRCARLSIMIGERGTRGQGYGTDAMRTLCRFGFEMMNLHRIELDVFAHNEAAIHVYEKVGFVREGLRKEAFWKEGRWLDIVGMGLLEGQLR